MKHRLGFVSNSSSSSFIIYRRYISDIMLDKISEHVKVVKNVVDAWSIEVEEDIVRCWTDMDNFDLVNYVIKIVGVPEEAIEYE